MSIKNKLVRDKIPEIIQSQGQSCTTRILDESEFETALKAKLYEEYLEYIADDSTEEIADMLEVIDAILHLRGLSIRGLESMRAKKVERNGAFDKRVYLMKTVDAIKPTELSDFAGSQRSDSDTESTTHQN